MIDPGDLDNLFTYHPPIGDQAVRYVAIRAMAKAFAQEILEKTPASAEQTLAIHAVQQASMWANAAIALHE